MFMVVSSACAHAQVEDYLQYVPTAMNFALEPCGAQPAHSLKDRCCMGNNLWRCRRTEDDGIGMAS